MYQSLKKTGELTNARPLNENQLTIEVACKMPQGKLSLSDAAMKHIGVVVGDKVMIEEFGEVFGIRKSDTDKGSKLDENGNFSAAAAWQKLGGVESDEEHHIYTTYGLSEVQEAEIEEGVVISTYILENKDSRKVTKRQSQEETTDVAEATQENAE